jgi:hypothetical protein
VNILSDYLYILCLSQKKPIGLFKNFCSFFPNFYSFDEKLGPNYRVRQKNSHAPKELFPLVPREKKNFFTKKSTAKRKEKTFSRVPKEKVPWERVGIFLPHPVIFPDIPWS